MIGRIIGNIAAVWVLLAATGALAGADVAETLRPYLSDQTLGVARIDLRQADPAGLQKALVDSLAQAKADGAIADEVNARLAPAAKRVGEALTAMKAAGAREAFVAASMADGQLRWLVVVPDVASLDDAAKAMQALGLATVTVDRTVLAGLDEKTIEAMRARPAADRADLLAILERADASPIRIAIAPGAAVRDTVERETPRSPRWLGGDAVTVLTRGAMSIEATLDAPPDWTMRLTIRSESPRAATALRRWIDDRLAPYIEDDEMNLEPFKPRLDGDTLSLTVDAAGRVALLRETLPLIVMQTDLLPRASSAAVLRQQLFAIMMIVDDGSGQPWPDSLDALAQFTPPGTSFINPRNPDRHGPHYIYIRPREPRLADLKTPQARLLIYEAFDEFGEGINVGFADGHVEWIADESKFQELLNTARDNAAKH